MEYFCFLSCLELEVKLGCYVEDAVLNQRKKTHYFKLPINSAKNLALLHTGMPSTGKECIC